MRERASHAFNFFFWILSLNSSGNENLILIQEKKKWRNGKTTLEIVRKLFINQLENGNEMIGNESIID